MKPLPDRDIYHSAKLYIELLGGIAARARVHRLVAGAEARGNTVGADNHRRVLAALDVLLAGGEPASVRDQ